MEPLPSPPARRVQVVTTIASDKTNLCFLLLVSYFLEQIAWSQLCFCYVASVGLTRQHKMIEGQAREHVYCFMCSVFCTCNSHLMDERCLLCHSPGVGLGEVDLGEYTRSIERLNTSLGFLQTEMQRLAQQQDRIMAMREQQQAWVIPPPAPSPHRYGHQYHISGTQDWHEN